MKQTDIPKLQKKKKSYNAFVFYLDFNGNRTRLKYYCVYHKNVTRTYDPNKTFGCSSTCLDEKKNILFTNVRSALNVDLVR